MSLLVFFLLAALTAVAIAYPLLTLPGPAHPEALVTEAEVDGAVRRLREARRRGEVPVSVASRLCPSCSAPYLPGDRFCVRCGQTLAKQEVAPGPQSRAACPACGAALRHDDLFCARCGYRLPVPGEGESLEEVQP